MRKHSARITNHREFSLLISLSIIILVVAAGCEAAEPAPTPTPEGRATEQPIVARPPLAATQTAAASQTPYVIERITLAANVSVDGEPVNEVSVFPDGTRALFLSVLVSSIRKETTFRAFWFESDQIIGDSEVTIPASESGSRWVSLEFQSLDALDPLRSYSVELRIDQRRIGTYAIRVGSGELADVISFATVALGTDAEGEPIGPGDTFDLFAGQIVAVVRVPDQIDPTGMFFSALLFREDTLIQQKVPDGSQPQLSPEPGPLDRQMTFTFLIADTFVPGKHSISILINGSEVRTIPFTFIDGRVPTATPFPTPTPAPTATPFVSGVELIQSRITRTVDEETGEPTGTSYSAWQGDPTTEWRFYVSVRLSDLRIDDVVEFDVIRNGRFVERKRYPVAAFEEGWLSLPVIVSTPPAGSIPNSYEFLIYISGTRVRTLQLTMYLPPEFRPTATPTPRPSN